MLTTAATHTAAASAYVYRRTPRVLLGFQVLCSWCRACFATR